MSVKRASCNLTFGKRLKRISFKVESTPKSPWLLKFIDFQLINFVNVIFILYFSCLTFA
jgi:hypothetical protein